MHLQAPPLSDLMNFAGQTVLVTGAGRGIGAGVARRFSQAGADLVVHYRRSAEEAEALRRELEGPPRKAITVAADVTDEADVERLVERADSAFDGLDVVINNAGIYPMSALVEMAAQEWDAVLASNLRSVFLTTRAAARRMIARGKGGAIVNIASIEAENPAPMHSHYNAAKAAVVMHTRAAAQELGQHGIRVNSVSPGLIARPGLEDDWPEGVERYLKAAPLARLGRPDDVADACLFLASPAARWVTGIDLRVDGGVMTQQIF